MVSWHPINLMQESQDQTYIAFSPELNELLGNQPSDFNLEARIRSELEREGVKAEIKWDKNPVSTEPDRELVLLILAIGASATLVGTAVSRVVNAVAQKQRANMRERQLSPALDGNGEPIYDRYGNPVYNVIDKPGDTAPEGENSRAKVKAGFLEFELTSGEAAKTK